MRPLLAVLVLVACAAPAWGEPLALDDAIRQARQGNPGLASRRASTEALAEVPSQMGALPDPALSLNAVALPVDSFSTSEENMTQMQVGVSQRIPFPGKLSQMEAAAAHAADGARWELLDQENDLVRRVRVGWWGLFFLDRALETVRKNQDLLRQLVRIAESKYALGAGLQQDALLAQLELTRLIDRELELAGQRVQAVAALNGLLNRPATAQTTLPAAVDASLPLLKGVDRLTAEAEKARPLLAARTEHERGADARLAYARKGYYPDLTVGALYGFREDNPMTGEPRSDLASMTVALSLPLWAGAKQSREIVQREREAEAQRAMTEETRNGVGVAIASFVADYRRARAQVELYRTGVIPLATQTVASMEAGYQVNKVDFLNLVRARITLYNYETDYWKGVAGAHQAAASLMAAVGTEDIYE